MGTRDAPSAFGRDDEGVLDADHSDTGDALLICHEQETESVRKVVEGLERSGREEIL